MAGDKAGMMVRDVFELGARRYDAAYDAPEAAGIALRSRTGTALELVGPCRGEVLDAGMGPGRLLIELDSRGWKVAGIDASAEMVSLARNRLPRASNRLLQARLEQLPFADETFDAAVATGVLEYVDDLAGSLSELARVTRPGGRLVVSIPNDRAPFVLWHSRVWYPFVNAVKRRVPFGRLPRARPGNSPSRAHLSRLMEKAGFEVKEVRYIVRLLVPAPLDAMVPRLAAAVALRLQGRNGRFRQTLDTQIVIAATKVQSTRSPSRLRMKAD